MRSYLSFEQPVADVDARIDELKAVAANGESPAIAEEIAKLEARSAKMLADLYAALTPWQKTMVARTQGRPHFADYVKALIEDFTPLAGDRQYGEDAAIVGGLGRFRGNAVCVMGHEKGDDTSSRLAHKFGMARPEGYRKAARLMELADRFGLPVISLIDTPGAWPGIDAEERGQAEAIALNLREMSRLGVPVVTIVIGEGGSGGALGLGIANRVYMLENAYYSVISPESCAAIIYRDSGRAADAAQALRLAAEDLAGLGLIDGIVKEPAEGAHTDPNQAATFVKETIQKALAELAPLSPQALIEERYKKFRAMGNFFMEAQGA
jgi:acetyl-CoA carboxylase carboxyl transferase subunit alpha